MAGKNQLPASIRNFLKGAKGKWGEEASRAKEGGEFQRLPDGRYTTRLTSAELAESNNGTPQIAWAYTVIEGEFTGEVLKNWDGLSNENSLYYLARTLNRFGIDPESVDIADLPDILAQLAEEAPVVVVRLRTKGEYQNLYIDRVVEDYDGDTGDGGATDDDDGAEEEAGEEETGEDEGATIDVGDRVTITVKGVEYEGEITSIDEENEKVKVKCDDKKIRTVGYDAISVPEADAEEEEAEEEVAEEESGDEEAEVELEEGMTVQYPWKGEDAVGVVRSIDEAAGTAKVVTDKKIRTVQISEISLAPSDEEEAEEEEVEEAPAPKTPARRKK